MKTDKHIRNTIIVIPIALVIVIVAVTFAIINMKPNQDGTPNEALPTQYQQGEGILIGQNNPDAPNLDLYFDYTCPGCVYVETAINPTLIEATRNGEINYVLHPVITASGPFNVAATAAMLAVADQDPEALVDLQDALTLRYLEVLETGDLTGTNTAEEASATVANIARKLEISDQIIDTFNADAAQQYLQTATNKWVALEVDGRENTATPELVYEGHQIQLSGTTPQEMVDAVKEQIG